MYAIKHLDGQWFIVSESGERAGPFASGVEARETLTVLRGGQTGTFAAEMTARQAAKAERREAEGR